MGLEITLFAKSLVVLGVIGAAAAVVIGIVSVIYIMFEAAYQLLKSRR